MPPRRRALLSETLWNRCLRVLENELTVQQFNTWVRPLQAMQRNGELRLLAPNRYVIDWLGENSLPRIKRACSREFGDGVPLNVVLDVGTRPRRGAQRLDWEARPSPTASSRTAARPRSRGARRRRCLGAASMRN